MRDKRTPKDVYGEAIEGLKGRGIRGEGTDSKPS